jgi:hypothetical protein
MIQKSSLPENLGSVSKALTSDTELFSLATGGSGALSVASFGPAVFGGWPSKANRTGETRQRTSSALYKAVFRQLSVRNKRGAVSFTLDEHRQPRTLRGSLGPALIPSARGLLCRLWASSNRCSRLGAAFDYRSRPFLQLAVYPFEERRANLHVQVLSQRDSLSHVA